MFKVRTANIDDIVNVYNLSNDDTVRKNSIHTEKILWENHTKWFNEKITSCEDLFYIAEYNNHFIGYCRLEKENGNWVITIHISPAYRGNGFGTRIISYVIKHNSDKKLKAFIKEENAVSYRMFLKCGFTDDETKIIADEKFRSLILKQKNIIAISNNIYDKTSLFDKKNILFIKNKEELSYENLKKINPKYVFFPHWSYIIQPEIFENFNCVIFHMTDLPFGRGGSPLQNLIERGIYRTKISAIKCIKELDAGDIFLKRDFDISYGSAQEIYARAGEIVSEMIDEIIETAPIPVPQNGKIVEFKRRTPEQSNIKGLKDINKIYDHIRMLDADGYPKAFLEYDNLKFEFSDAKIKDGKIIATVEIEAKNDK